MVTTIVMKVHPDHREASQARDFHSFFTDERDALFRMLVLVTGSVDEAEDLVQEAFLRVWERWAHVEGLANPIGYLHTTALNCFRSRYRHAMFVAKRQLQLGREQSDPLTAVEARDA